MRRRWPGASTGGTAGKPELCESSWRTVISSRPGPASSGRAPRHRLVERERASTDLGHREHARDDRLRDRRDVVDGVRERGQPARHELPPPERLVKLRVAAARDEEHEAGHDFLRDGVLTEAPHGLEAQLHGPTL
jgi:hypothetical protein